MSSDVSTSYDEGDPSASAEAYRSHRRSQKRSKRRSYRPSHQAGYQRLGGQLADAWHSVTGFTARPGQPRPGLDEDSPHVDEHHLDETDYTSPAMDIENGLKRYLYLLLEQPSSSRAAFWTNVVVSFLIVSSAVMTTIETIPAFRSAESNRVWFHLESTMVALFTLEYLLRLFAHSDSLLMLRKFVLAPISIIDFISIVPFYIELIAQRDTTYEFRFTILRLFRLLRLFKTYKYSNAIIMTIEVMMVALRRSGDALSALFFFLVTCVVLFSTLLYFAERGTWDETLKTFVDPDGNPSAFDSIPAAFWFVLVTITTTGYGDMVPTTFIGKLVTFPAMMFGVLLIALPSIIVGRNFTIVWEAMRRRQYLEQLQYTNTDAPDQHPANAGNMASRLSDTFQPMSRPSMAIDDPLGNPTTRGRSGSFHTLPGGEPFNLLGNTTDDELFSQLHALMSIARQNQQDIQRIFSLLEAQTHPKSHVQSPLTASLETTGPQPTNGPIDEILPAEPALQRISEE
ncbi:voltage-gated potassium channel [Hesseltinella vesiculosa]|uniref:Voltage-gated potassium channel n=1 Tax=Hesseltinella vesiculosa TaxID=101127 RepID=A0A1X2G505_9FUNG|nr:voltage-gated potassium channel [Hesseltinella vesiculosa]